jgi:transposase
MAIGSVDRMTLYHWFDTWEAHHFAGLEDKKRGGRPPKLTAAEQDKAQQDIEPHPREVRKGV